MAQTIRATLEGYDALTETDPDRFSLYADSDWILIKEHSRGSGTISFGSSQTISHNLGYIPAYIVWAEVDDGTYRMVNAQSPLGGGWKSYATTSDLIIQNQYSSSYTGYRYYIFYDDMSTGGTPSITESDVAIKVSKSGVDALSSTNPNDYIFHSDLNTFKILGEGTILNQTVDSNPKVFTLAHGQGSAIAVYGFADFGDGKAVQAGGKARYDSVMPVEYYWRIEVDDTYIRFIFYQPEVPPDNYDVDIKYYIFETPAT